MKSLTKPIRIIVCIFLFTVCTLAVILGFMITYKNMTFIKTGKVVDLINFSNDGIYILGKPLDVFFKSFLYEISKEMPAVSLS